MAMTINFDSENFGKLFIRFFLGVYFIVIGIHFFVSGHSALVFISKVLKVLHFKFSPMLFGSSLASIQIVCGMTVLLGFLFRLSCFLLGSVVLLDAIIAFYMHNNVFSSILPTALLSMILFGMIFVGGGKFSVSKSK